MVADQLRPLTLPACAVVILNPIMSQRNGRAVVAASGLTKIYDGRPVVDAIDLCVESGECFGILGPNGAGKTTTLRMLIGLSPPTAGNSRCSASRSPNALD